MHQQTRLPSTASTPGTAQSTHTPPSSSPNASGHAAPRARTEENGSAMSGPAERSPGPSRESVKKLDQIIQNFYTKAAILILKSRMRVQPHVAIQQGRARQEVKRNKWFQIDTEEIQDFKESLLTWKTCGSFEHRPPPMIVEVYLDASTLKKGKCLVAVDGNGRRWDVADALGEFDNQTEAWRCRPEVLLERWRIELKGCSISDADDFGPVLPSVYKKSIVLFRSLYTTALSLPAHKVAKQSMAKVVPPALDVKCRIATNETNYQGFDPIRHNLYGTRDEVATDFVFGDVELPVGRFYASVTYRNDCHFRVVDSESLLSSQLGMTGFDFAPSVAQGGENTSAVGSVPYETTRGSENIIQPIASAGTFHGFIPTGTSPMTTVRNHKAPSSESSSVSPTGSVYSSSRGAAEMPQSLPAPTPTHSGRAAGKRTHERRPPAFKAGSLSGSSPLTRAAESEAPASPHTGNRPGGPNALTHSRKPSSLTRGMPASLRGGPPPPAAEFNRASPPKPAGGSSRFSSSFSSVNQHRRSRPSISGGANKAVEDEQSSSGRQSLSSSVAQPSSGLLAEPGTASSGSLQQDQDAISEFLKALDSRKTLHSFEAPRKGETSSGGRKTVVELSKFQSMRDSNHALTESMTSSIHLPPRLSSTSSRQFIGAPGMASAPLSTASSPSKPLSPHTPHTPAVPSRLSENSIIDYPTAGHYETRRAEAMIPESGSGAITRPEGTTAIDIPLSPRLAHVIRPTSSGVIGAPSIADGDDDDDDDDEGGTRFGARSRSTPPGNQDDVDAPPLSALLSRNGAELGQAQTATSHIRDGVLDMAQQGSYSSAEKPPGGLLAGLAASPRRRYTGLGKRQTPPLAGGSASPASGGGQGSRWENNSNTQPTVAVDMTVDEELLLFDMSEIGQGRRHIGGL